MSKCNCKGCNKRYVGCHSSCQSYLDYSEERSRIREVKQNDYTYYEYARQCSDKACRIHFGKAHR